MPNITSWTDLSAMRSSPTAAYTLTNNLLPTDADYSSAGGDDWEPVGNGTDPANTSFSGSLSGNGFRIKGLIVTQAVLYLDTEYAIGLIGYLTGSLDNVYLVDGGVEFEDLDPITDADFTYDVGHLVGNAEGTITDCFSSGDVTIEVGDDTLTNPNSISCSAGGLVGAIASNSVTNCYASGNVVVNGYNANYGQSQSIDGLDIIVPYAGGLVGIAVQVGTDSTIQYSYSTGTVTADGYSCFAGGCIGGVGAGVTTFDYIDGCFATGLASQTDYLTPTVVAGNFIGRKMSTEATITGDANYQGVSSERTIAIAYDAAVPGPLATLNSVGYGYDFNGAVSLFYNVNQDFYIPWTFEGDPWWENAQYFPTIIPWIHNEKSINNDEIWSINGVRKRSIQKVGGID